MKTCTKCRTEKVSAEFHRDPRNRDGLRSWCKGCISAQRKGRYDRAQSTIQLRAWRARNPYAVRKAEQRRVTVTYGLTPAAFDKLLVSQVGRCAICNTEMRRRGEPQIDHNRACCPGKQSCGKCVRGLLCSGCNRGIGLMRDDAAVLRSASAYIMEFI